MLNHRHEIQRSRRERLYTQRFETYQTLARFLERERLRLHRTAPIMTPVPEPPPEATDEEWIALSAAASIAGTREVDDAMNSYAKTAQAFAAHVFTLRAVQQQNAHQQIGEAWQEVTSARTAALSAIENVERVMRDELASL